MMTGLLVKVKNALKKKSNTKKFSHFSTMVLNGPEIVICKKSVKNIILRIDRQGVIKVSAPVNCSIETIRKFITQKQVWISKTQERLMSKPVPVSVIMETGTLCAHLGSNYLLRVEKTVKEPNISFSDNHICCFVKPDTTPSEKQKFFQSWQCEQLKSLLPTLIKKWESILDVQVNQWRIRAMKTRWGSCNPVRKHISLNLYLIQKPLVCLEYVLVHEMVHLLEASHNQRFHALMTRYLPDWKKYKVLLG